MLLNDPMDEQKRANYLLLIQSRLYHWLGTNADRTIRTKTLYETLPLSGIFYAYWASGVCRSLPPAMLLSVTANEKMGAQIIYIKGWVVR